MSSRSAQDIVIGREPTAIEFEDEMTVQPCTCRIVISNREGTFETDPLEHEINCLWRKQEERMWSRKQTTTNAQQVVKLERDRIRTELIDWLIGRLDPKDAGLINGRRIVDEIDRICATSICPNTDCDGNGYLKVNTAVRCGICNP